MIENTLREAETRLRAIGLTGDAAFRTLIASITARLEGGDEHPELVDLELPTQGMDLLGLAYERFFPDLFKGRLGQYFTPPTLVRLLLSQLPIEPGTDVLDPTCGSGGLLLAAARRGATVRGLDIDPRLVGLASLNLRLAAAKGDVERADFFASEPKPTAVLIANPPFSVPIRERSVLDRYPIGGGRERVLSDVLFLHALADWVEPGGWAGVIVPWNVVANPRMSKLRAHLDAHFCKRAILALPEGVFRPFGGAQGRAAMLWLQRRPCDEAPTRWASLVEPGYDTRSKRLRRTSEHEVDRLIDGQGWQTVQGWTPTTLAEPGTPLRQVARAPSGTEMVHGTTQLIELGDVDPRTLEALPRTVELSMRRQPIARHDVLVARMRPARGTVTIAPTDGHGSPEWIRLQSAHPHVLFHALRSPTWHTTLPPTTGQTRPRTDAKSVLATRIRMPAPAVAAQLEALSAGLHRTRRELGARLVELQALVDAHQAGEIDDPALESALVGLKRTLDRGDP